MSTTCARLLLGAFANGVRILREFTARPKVET